MDAHRHRREAARARRLERPGPSTCGTLRQQFQVLELYFSNPWQIRDKARRWEAARRTVIQQARATA
jgi:hypothetical protein